MELSENWQKSFAEARMGVDEKRLNRYLCRQVRRHLKKLYTDTVNIFTVTERVSVFSRRGKRHRSGAKRNFRITQTGDQYVLLIKPCSHECGQKNLLAEAFLSGLMTIGRKPAARGSGSICQIFFYAQKVERKPMETKMRKGGDKR